MCGLCTHHPPTTAEWHFLPEPDRTASAILSTTTAMPQAHPTCGGNTCHLHSLAKHNVCHNCMYTTSQYIRHHTPSMQGSQVSSCPTRTRAAQQTPCSICFADAVEHKPIVSVETRTAATFPHKSSPVFSSNSPDAMLTSCTTTGLHQQEPH